MSNPHFVVSVAAAPSHIRTLCVLAAKIACARPITVTILVANIFSIAEHVATEVSRCLEEEGPLEGQHRIVAIGPRSTNSADVLKADSFEPVWKALVDELPVRCSDSGIVHPVAARPSIVLLDGFQITWLNTIRSTHSSPPVLLWMSAFAGGVLRVTGPESMGGRGDSLRAVSDADLNDPEGMEQEITGDVIRVVGMPPMHDWEFFPQALGLKKGKVFAAEAAVAKSMEAADGLVTSCAAEHDGEECISAISTWISGLGDRPTFHLGPMLLLKPGTCEFSKASLDAEMATAPGETGVQVSQFLDRAYNRYGECSVVYISLGTVYWPSTTEHLSVLLHFLEQRGIPFIFAHAAPIARIADSLRIHFENSEIGLLSPWVPQQAILAHRACGWFITHGGANGTMEALSQGVPMIGWPFTSDQPNNIAHLVHHLDVAFEFIEVRTGELGLKPIFMTGKTPSGTVEAFEKELDEVLDLMKGEVGARKRANARKIRERLAAAWKSDGNARKAFEKFLDSYCSL